MDRTKNSLRNIFYGLISKMITLVLPFAIRTAIIYRIGIEYVGLNSLFTSVLNFLSLSELGFGSAIVFMLYKPVNDGDTEAICNILNFIKKIYRIIGIIIFAAGVIIMPFIDKLISGSYPDDINIYLLYFIFLLNTTVSYFLYAYKGVIFNAYQRVDITNKIASVVTLIAGIVEISVIFLTKNYYLYVICIPAFTIVQNLITGYIARKTFPQLKEYGSISAEKKKDIGKKVFALTGHKIGGTVVGSLDSIVISAILGLVALAKYSNYFLVISALMGIINILMQAILPSIGNYLLNHNVNEKEQLFKKTNFLTVWIAGWCSVCLLCLYQPFMELWIGKEYLLPFSTVVWFGLYFYSWQFRVLVVNYKDAAGLWSEDVLKPYVASLVNVILNIYLVKKIGINGALISTIFCMFFIFFPWETEVLYRKLFLKKSVKFYLESLLYLLIWCGLAFISYAICLKLTSIFNNNIMILITRLIVCLIIPNVIYYLIFIKSDYILYCKGVAKQLIKRG